MQQQLLLPKALTASFLGMVGDDQFGHFLKNTLNEKDIETSGLILSKQYQYYSCLCTPVRKCRARFFFLPQARGRYNVF